MSFNNLAEAHVLDALRRQFHVELPLIELHLKRVEWDARGFVARLYPFTRSRAASDASAPQPRIVTMDPRVAFGRPALKSSGVPTAVIADRYKAGESIADLADDYGEAPANIEEAIRCELQPAKAA